MSILNDDRQYSDDPEEYLAWKWEVEREYRKQEYLDKKEYEDAEQDYDS